MKIGIIAPLSYPVPPEKYGGTELVIYYVAEGLVSRGHDITLFACEGSKTSANLDATWGKQLSGSTLDKGNLFYSLSRIDYIIKKSLDFDIVHAHDGLLSLSLQDHFRCPVVATFHTSVALSLGWDSLGAREKIFKRSKIISISNAQRKEMPDANYIGTVYNGTVDFDKYHLGEGGGGYLAWLGRFNPYKGAKEAIVVAKKTGKKLILAGQIGEEDKEYFKKEIEPEIDNDYIKYIGEVDIGGKDELLGNAEALLMPISWEEPFGLVMIEAMACGSPVIAFNRGSVSEVVDNRKSGFVVAPNNINEMTEAVKEIDKIDRSYCREWVRNNFSIDRMVKGYESLYREYKDSK